MADDGLRVEDFWSDVPDAEMTKADVANKHTMMYIADKVRTLPCDNVHKVLDKIDDRVTIIEDKQKAISTTGKVLAALWAILTTVFGLLSVHRG